MIRAYVGPAVLTIAVEGSATMAETPAVHASASEHMTRGIRALRLDLRDCTTMDSTFTGTLLSLQRQLDGVAGTFALVSPSPRVLELLCEMGLEDFYMIELAPPPSGPWTEVSTARRDAEALKQRILEAHDELARVPGAATIQFAPVAEELHRDGQSPEDASLPTSSHLN